MTAELLRRAADRIDKLATAATPGPWEPEYSYGHDRVQAVYVMDPEHPDHIDDSIGIGGFDKAADNEWAIALGPQIAAPLAAWFRSQADETAMIDEMNAAASSRAQRTGGDGHTFVIQPDRTAHATYLARAILGEDA